MAESWRGLSCGSERENVKLIFEGGEQVLNRQILNCAHGDSKWMDGWCLVGLMCGFDAQCLVGCAGVLVVSNLLGVDRQLSKTVV